MKITTNKKAYHEYHVLEDFDAGIVLLGSEVKSVRQGNVVIRDSYGYVMNGEVWLKNMIVARYKQSYAFQPHDESRDKKLLLSRREINRIIKLTQDKGITIVPLEVFLAHNYIKVKIGIVRGKKLWNKKEDIRRKDLDRDMRSELSN